jgi:hypothetical protein
MYLRTEETCGLLGAEAKTLEKLVGFRAKTLPDITERLTDLE